METFFASPERLDPAELKPQIEAACRSPVVTTLLYTVEGCIAVLNEHRQILAVNNAYLEFLGIHDAADVLGLRPGEAVHCVHANDAPGGCGTGRICSTCGAAIAMAASLGTKEPVEKFCSLNVRTVSGEMKNFFLAVRAVPFVEGGLRFVLLFLRDITRQNQWAALERVFFHDIINIIHSMSLISELMLMGGNSRAEAQKLNGLARHLANEVTIQRALIEDNTHIYQPLLRDIPISAFLEQLLETVYAHPSARGRTLSVVPPPQDLTARTDYSLLFRVIFNLMVNALEATPENGEASIRLQWDDSHLSFHIWNRDLIPEEVRHRIFQRNFSTKKGPGRGQGTFAIKFFGEQILGGAVAFESTEETGTTFTFKIKR